jgi:predicted glycosyltransferase involved in capsule biosynthesis
LIAVNGFNEDFVGWGFEDSDLAIRLIRAGIRVKSGRFATNVLHLWHPESSRSNIENNKALLKNSWSNDIKVPEGLDKHVAVTLWD